MKHLTASIIITILLTAVPAWADTIGTMDEAWTMSSGQTGTLTIETLSVTAQGELQVIHVNVSAGLVGQAFTALVTGSDNRLPTQWDEVECAAETDDVIPGLVDQPEAALPLSLTWPFPDSVPTVCEVVVFRHLNLTL